MCFVNIRCIAKINCSDGVSCILCSHAPRPVTLHTLHSLQHRVMGSCEVMTTLLIKAKYTVIFSVGSHSISYHEYYETI